MKRLLAVLLSLTLMASAMVLNVVASAAFIPGTFVGVGEGGYGGDITVSVVFDADSIVSIEVTDHSETAGIGDIGIMMTIANILDAQSTHVDLVAGVTMTAYAIVNAVEDAMRSAGMNPAAILPIGRDAAAATDTVADVIVVGSGFAGLMAAINAAENGASVILIEAMGLTGGSSRLSGGWLAAAETRYQDACGIEDTREEMLEGWLTQQELSARPSDMFPIRSRVEAMVNTSRDILYWLSDRGLDIIPLSEAFGGRWHGPGSGGVLVDFLVDQAQAAGVQIVLNTRGMELVTDNGAVTGIIAQTSAGEVVYHANSAVILATGGFAHNAELMERWVPEFLPFMPYSTTAPGHRGDGILMAEAVGAALYEEPWVMSMGFPWTPVTGLPGRPSTSVFVNIYGNRFVNEEVMMSHWSYMVLYSGGASFMIIDSSERFDNIVTAIDGRFDGEYAFTADSIAELAEQIGAPAAALQATLDQVADVAAGNAVDEFGRSAENSVPLTEAPFFAVRYIPRDGGTFGGVKTNENRQVLNTEGRPIPGLFAAGEMANRPYYNQSYVPATAVLISLTHGFTAGEAAALAGTRADVIVVGSGMTGLSAAVRAAQEGASVILIEAMGLTGGSSRLSGGGISASDTRFQEEQDIVSTSTRFLEYWLTYQEYSVAERELDEARIERAVMNSASRIYWLYDMGMEFGPISFWFEQRVHGPAAGGGGALIDFMVERAEELGVQILLNTRGRELVMTGNAVTGIIADTPQGNVEFTANNGVILATGGFVHNAELIERFVPWYAPFIEHSTSAPGHRGDGIIMAEAIGAAVYSEMWVIPFSGPFTLVPGVGPRPSGHLIVNHEGNRFFDETRTGAGGHGLHSAIATYSVGGAFMIFDNSETFAQAAEAAADNLDGVNAFMADTVAGLAGEIGVSAANLQAAIDHAAAVAAGDADDEFGRPQEAALALTEGPFYAILYLIRDAGSIGGVHTDELQRVLDTNGNVIPGLFAGGEMANRSYYNQIYPGGTALLLAVTHGMVAGEAAAAPRMDSVRADVVVVGAGMTGLSAAVAAAQEGASVVLLEAMGITGGSSRISGGWHAASNSRLQEEQGIPQTNEYFFNYWVGSQDFSLRVDASLPCQDRVLRMVEGSAERIEWLYDLGMEFVDIPLMWGYRAHGPGSGGALIDFMLEAALDLGVEVFMNTRGMELVQDADGVVTGVIAVGADGDVVFEANNGVVLATGGFARNEELMRRFVPDFVPFMPFSTAGAGHRGDGILMAEAVGAVMHENKWILPLGGPFTVVPDVGPRPAGHIFVNHEGNRFVSEVGVQFHRLFAYVATYTEAGAFMIFDSGEIFETAAAAAAGNLDGVNAFMADTIADLADQIGVSAANLQAALDHAADVAAGNADDEFGRPADAALALTEGPFYAIRFVLRDMGTMGGVITDEYQRVLDANGAPIIGLFAGGEMTNRPYYNQIYPAGTSMLITNTHGFIAGTTAAQGR